MATSKKDKITELPYGVWVCRGGREVLFNRSYHPIWQRVSRAVCECDRSEWVEGKISQEWFYKDGNSPWVSRRTFIMCQNILKDFKAGARIIKMVQP